MHSCVLMRFFNHNYSKPSSSSPSFALLCTRVHAIDLRCSQGACSKYSKHQMWRIILPFYLKLGRCFAVTCQLVRSRQCRCSKYEFCFWVFKTLKISRQFGPETVSAYLEAVFLCIQTNVGLVCDATRRRTPKARADWFHSSRGSVSLGTDCLLPRQRGIARLGFFWAA